VVAQVRDGAGTVVGSGFLVAEDLLVTWAHVREDGGHGPGDVVPLVFPRALGAPAISGRVVEGSWRDPHEQDVALVRLERSVGSAPPALGSAAGSRGHRVRSFGFPRQAPPGGHLGFGTAGGLLPAADGAGDLLQLTDANDLITGFSGGPVLAEVTGLVVGMVTAITAPDDHARGQGIAYATPHLSAARGVAGARRTGRDALPGPGAVHRRVRAPVPGPRERGAPGAGASGRRAAGGGGARALGGRWWDQAPRLPAGPSPRW
jgi:hypothetical protein